jgi:hypothetical protein
MSELLITQLKHESKMHKLSGANGLSQLFDSAAGRITELESTVDCMERAHNEIVGAILDLDEMEQGSDEMANAEQDLLELAMSSKVYGVPSEYRDLSGTKRIAELEQSLGLTKITLDHKKNLLKSCEAALEERDVKIAELEKDPDDLTDDLIETQNQAREAENKLEDIESVFCDEDGCPLIEPFNGDGLSRWIAKRDIEQQANGVSRFAKLHLGEHSLYSSFAKNYCSVLLMQAKQLRAEVSNG